MASAGYTGDAAKAVDSGAPAPSPSPAEGQDGKAAAQGERDAHDDGSESAWDECLCEHERHAHGAFGCEAVVSSGECCSCPSFAEAAK